MVKLNETYDDVKAALNAEVVTPDNPSPTDIPPIDSKTHLSESISEQSIENLLEFPFSAARMMTDYQGFRINPLAKNDIVKMGKQACDDFGIILFSKWVNLSMFLVLYCGSGLMSVTGYMAMLTKQKQLQKGLDGKKKTSEKETPTNKEETKKDNTGKASSGNGADIEDITN